MDKEKDVTKMLDMAVRMKLMTTIDESIKRTQVAYGKIDLRTLDLQKLKNISDAFEGLAKAMEG